MAYHMAIHKESLMPFSMLLNLVGSSNANNKDIIWKFINNFIKKLNLKIINMMITISINYFKDKVEPNEKFKNLMLRKKALKSSLRLKTIDQSLKPEEIKLMFIREGKG